MELSIFVSMEDYEFWLLHFCIQEHFLSLILVCSLLQDLKALLSSMKKEFIDLESQYQRDLKKLGKSC